MEIDHAYLLAQQAAVPGLQYGTKTHRFDIWQQQIHAILAWLARLTEIIADW
jgi:S-formylglutathione hydrolase FrmB